MECQAKLPTRNTPRVIEDSAVSLFLYKHANVPADTTIGLKVPSELSVVHFVFVNKDRQFVIFARCNAHR